VRFSELIQNEINNYRDQNQEITEADIEQISNYIWNSYVNETLINKQIDRYKLYATDNEIYEVLVNNPPQFLIQNEAFQTNGNSITRNTEMRSTTHRAMNGWPSRNMFGLFTF
jgi:hypothetical protein